LLYIGFIQTQVSEHFLKEPRPNLFLAVLHDRETLARREGAVTAFALLPNQLQLETTFKLFWF